MSEKPPIIDAEFVVITPSRVQMMPPRRVRRPLWFRLLQMGGLLLFIEGIVNIFTDGSVSRWINHLIP